MVNARCVTFPTAPISTWEAHHCRCLFAHAEAISIEPQTCDFGFIRVGHPVKRTMTLFNQSDGVQPYHLDLIRVGENESRSTPVDFVDAHSLEKLENNTHAQGAEFWVDEPTGTIPPRCASPASMPLDTQPAAFVQPSTAASGTCRAASREELACSARLLLTVSRHSV